MSKSKNRSGVLGALILGASVGVAVGLLIAPEKGSVTLKKLESKGDELASDIKSQVNEILADITVESVLEKAQQILENGKTKVDKYKSN